MDEGALGKEYADKEVICRQGESGERMYVIQAGRAAVFREEGGAEVLVGELTVGDVFGEMAIFEKEPRSATVRARGTARVLTLDKRAFLRRVHEDPSLAYRILQDMSHRVRNLDGELSRLKIKIDKFFSLWSGLWQDQKCGGGGRRETERAGRDSGG